jgi:acetyltransferase-like isoleucine patch superfamily enzyme
VQNGGFLEIKDRVFFNNFCSINCLEKISIGENTLFGENVKLYDHNHSYERNEDGLQVSHSEFRTAPIIIGKNCWLGSNVVVLKGVTIGDNSIIGAGCIIHKNIPADSTVLNQQELIVKIN